MNNLEKTYGFIYLNNDVNGDSILHEFNRQNITKPNIIVAQTDKELSIDNYQIVPISGKAAKDLQLTFNIANGVLDNVINLIFTEKHREEVYNDALYKSDKIQWLANIYNEFNFYSDANKNIHYFQLFTFVKTLQDNNYSIIEDSADKRIIFDYNDELFNFTEDSKVILQDSTKNNNIFSQIMTYLFIDEFYNEKEIIVWNFFKNVQVILGTTDNVTMYTFYKKQSMFSTTRPVYDSNLDLVIDTISSNNLTVLRADIQDDEHKESLFKNKKEHFISKFINHSMTFLAKCLGALFTFWFLILTTVIIAILAFGAWDKVTYHMVKDYDNYNQFSVITDTPMNGNYNIESITPTEIITDSETFRVDSDFSILDGKVSKLYAEPIENSPYTNLVFENNTETLEDDKVMMLLSFNYLNMSYELQTNYQYNTFTFGNDINLQSQYEVVSRPTNNIVTLKSLTNDKMYNLSILLNNEDDVRDANLILREGNIIHFENDLGKVVIELDTVSDDYSYDEVLMREQNFTSDALILLIVFIYVTVLLTYLALKLANVLNRKQELNKKI